MTSAPITITGLTPLVRELRGPMFTDVNSELRSHAKTIAAGLAPHVADAVRRSGAPQAGALAGTVRPHSDRVPVVVVGKVNPKFSKPFRGGDTKRRRGSLAHGIVYGPLGGNRNTPAPENYYRIARDPSGGALGQSARSGSVYDAAVQAYLTGFLDIMTRHGFVAATGDAVQWRGGSL